MPTHQEIFDCPMGEDNDADADTVGGYLVKLLSMVWAEGESFSGKRPFGDSGWEYDIYKALGAAGYIQITLDEDGYVESVDDSAADAMIADLIASLAPR